MSIIVARIVAPCSISLLSRVEPLVEVYVRALLLENFLHHCDHFVVLGRANCQWLSPEEPLVVCLDGTTKVEGAAVGGCMVRVVCREDVEGDPRKERIDSDQAVPRPES